MFIGHLQGLPLHVFWDICPLIKWSLIFTYFVISIIWTWLYLVYVLQLFFQSDTPKIFYWYKVLTLMILFAFSSIFYVFWKMTLSLPNHIFQRIIFKFLCMILAHFRGINIVHAFFMGISDFRRNYLNYFLFLMKSVCWFVVSQWNTSMKIWVFYSTLWICVFLQLKQSVVSISSPFCIYSRNYLWNAARQNQWEKPQLRVKNLICKRDMGELCGESS